VHERRLAGIEFLAELANGFEERQALDVADRAADFAQHKIRAAIVGQHEVFDGVCDVRDHLHCRAKIIAASFFCDDFLVDAPRGDVVALRGAHTGEAFVVTEIEIGLSAIVRDEDFAVLIRAHRAGIDVEIRI
jgi:hypothetical protein